MSVGKDRVHCVDGRQISERKNVCMSVLDGVRVR